MSCCRNHVHTTQEHCTQFVSHDRQVFIQHRYVDNSSYMRCFATFPVYPLPYSRVTPCVLHRQRDAVDAQFDGVVTS